MNWKFWKRPALRIEIVLGDITKQRVDAIVNAAKPSLLGGGGVDGAIHKAGGPSILAQCRILRDTMYQNGLPTGQAVATTAGRMSAEGGALWVIHTVGPIYIAFENRTPQLRNCYVASLAVADKVGARTVAFPLISSGVYGWPVSDAITQALIALRKAKTKVKVARLVLFDEPTFRLAQAVAKL